MYECCYITPCPAAVAREAGDFRGLVRAVSCVTVGEGGGGGGGGGGRGWLRSRT